MTDVAIQVQGLGKQYKLGAARKSYKTLRESLAHIVRASVGGRNGKNASGDAQKFWALKDVNFEVKTGEVIGIIGRNGAGKSTLLKILSRITDPTEGEVDILGRVGSLLEVGTGFHPELTGRENIYLNGAILGMKRGEVARKFDEIVAFAETEKFLDTPVKYYSSGMYMRLAFAVAANLEPDILIVDEVLAVGDATFQRKCLGRMGEVAESGRTVLFVSHNMSAVQQLCSRCVMLRQGQVRADGPVADVVAMYLREAAPSSTVSRPAKDNGEPTIVKAKVSSAGSDADAKIRFDLDISCARTMPVAMDIRLSDGSGFAVGLASLGTFDPGQMIELAPGVTRVSATVHGGRLAVGSYLASLDLTTPFVRFYDRLDNALIFDISRPPTAGYERVLMQGWGLGSYEIPAELLSVEPVETSGEQPI
jgi:lipopolysaccharide transport system ATP-binding protein